MFDLAAARKRLKTLDSLAAHLRKNGSTADPYQLLALMEATLAKVCELLRHAWGSSTQLTAKYGRGYGTIGFPRGHKNTRSTI